MKPRTQMLLMIAGGMVSLAVAVVLVLNALGDNLVFFHTPTEVHERQVPENRTIRIGGLVEEGSVQRQEGTTEVHFSVTDQQNSMRVSYTGILPDLFREGQGVVAEGKLTSEGTFIASRVFARHDETYMPPEAAEALKRAHEAATTGDAATPAPATGGY